MPEKNTLHKAGDYILEGPLMAGSSSENFSFQDLVSEINIYQDIDSPYMSGSIFVTEAAGLYERMPIIGEEFLHITFKTKGATSDDEIDFIIRCL